MMKIKKQKNNNLILLQKNQDGIEQIKILFNQSRKLV